MRYLLFAGHCYYPAGGAGDFRGFYPTTDEAKLAFIAKKDEIRGDSYVENWAHITDEDMKVICSTEAAHISGDYNTMQYPVWTDELEVV